MTLKDQSFVFLHPWSRVTFKFWERLKNASGVTLVPKNFFFPYNFSTLCKVLYFSFVFFCHPIFTVYGPKLEAGRGRAALFRAEWKKTTDMCLKMMAPQQTTAWSWARAWRRRCPWPLPWPRSPGWTVCLRRFGTCLLGRITSTWEQNLRWYTCIKQENLCKFKFKKKISKIRLTYCMNFAIEEE